ELRAGRARRLRRAARAPRRGAAADDADEGAAAPAARRLARTVDRGLLRVDGEHDGLRLDPPPGALDALRHERGAANRDDARRAPLPGGPPLPPPPPLRPLARR